MATDDFVSVLAPVVAVRKHSMARSVAWTIVVIVVAVIVVRCHWLSTTRIQQH